MSAFDFDAASKRASNVLRKAGYRRASLLLLPITTHLSSIATLSVAWFARGGSFQFNASAIADWGAVGLAILVGVGGIDLIRRALPPTTEMVLSRDELGDLLAVARSDADISIHIVAGDLSWLPDDLDSLIAIKTRKPSLRITVHYDRDRVAKSEVGNIETLSNKGIVLRPYTDIPTLTSRFTLIDIEDQGTTRVFTYDHARVPNALEPRGENRFLWRAFGPHSTIAISAFSTVISMLRRTQPEPIRIGISGVNNVGKTSLANALRAELSGQFKVHLIPDQFRHVSGGATVNGSIAILLSELARAPSEDDADVVIYDRTILDNLIFLRLRAQADDVYNALIKPIVTIVKSLDLIVYVKPADGAFSAGTTFVSANDRQRISEFFDECLAAYDITHQEVALGAGTFTADVRGAAQKVATTAREIYHRKRIAPL